MKDLIKYKVETPDNDISVNDTINKINNKHSLPDLYSKGFTNSKYNYRETYDLSKENQFLSSKEDYNYPLKRISDSENYYKNENESYGQNKKYLDRSFRDRFVLYFI